MDLVTSYYDLILMVKTTSGIPDPLLHMHAGMAIYLVSQMLLGSRRASWMALSIVLEIELFNEVMNYLYYGSWRWADTLQDIALTLFWPTMCVLAGKYRRWRWTQIKKRELAVRFAAAPARVRTPAP